jgi:chromosome partitioning protein
LAIDLDPQASLTALHGVQPEFDLLDGGTLYDAIRYEDPVPILPSSARPTSRTSI